MTKTLNKSLITLPKETLVEWFHMEPLTHMVPRTIIETMRGMKGRVSKSTTKKGDVFETRHWDHLYQHLGDTWPEMTFEAFTDILDRLGFSEPHLNEFEKSSIYLCSHKEKGLVLWANFLTTPDGSRILVRARVYGEIRFTGVYHTKLVETTSTGDVARTYREEPVKQGQFLDAWKLTHESEDIGYYDGVHLLSGCPFAFDATRGLANFLAWVESCKVEYNPVWTQPLSMKEPNHHLFHMSFGVEGLSGASSLKSLHWALTETTDTIRSITERTIIELDRHDWE